MIKNATGNGAIQGVGASPPGSRAFFFPFVVVIVNKLTCGASLTSRVYSCRTFHTCKWSQLRFTAVLMLSVCTRDLALCCTSADVHQVAAVAGRLVGFWWQLLKAEGSIESIVVLKRLHVKEIIFCGLKRQTLFLEAAG